MKKNVVVLFALGLIVVIAVYFLSDKASSPVMVDVGQGAVGSADHDKNQLPHKNGLLRVDPNDPDVVESQRRLWIELPFALVKSRAEQGNAEAQWQLSQMYDYCLLYNLKPQATLDGFEYAAKKSLKAKRNVEQIRKALVERCATVDEGRVIPGEAVKLWLEQSAKNGVLAAKLRQATLVQESNSETLLGYVDAVKRSKSPREVFEMGTLARLIEPHWKEEKTADAFSDGKYAQYAWEIAACRSGLDCSQASNIMYWMCYQGGCGYDNYEQFIMNTQITPAGRDQLEETIRVIQEGFLK